MSEKQNLQKKTFLGGVLVLMPAALFAKVIGLFYKIPLIAIVGVEGMAYFLAAYHVYSLLCKGLGHAKYDCFVAVYDWQGNYEGLISFKVEDGYEPENISIVDGEMYVMCCSPQPVTTFYKITLVD